ncbi:MAG TPA: exodeoxyribonuclease VII small subunit [Gammaproteobacteria bacterium]|nr:exodeoxyribonuclease VII small subunit [Gammaproteobacteria bacterium]
MPRKKAPEKPDFEQSMKALEQLVERLENGDLTLEESLQEFERGMVLTRQCQTLLEEAEQRVRILTEKNSLANFNGSGNDE